MRPGKRRYKAKVKIYTIGIGDGRQGSRGLFGQTLVNQGNDLDERTLIQIAELTGGKYFRARDPKELERIYDQLNLLEPIEQEAELLHRRGLCYDPLPAVPRVPEPIQFAGGTLLLICIGAARGRLRGVRSGQTRDIKNRWVGWQLKRGSGSGAG